MQKCVRNLNDFAFQSGEGEENWIHRIFQSQLSQNFLTFQLAYHNPSDNKTEL